ncbi:MAG: Chromosome partition protein Smc [Parcubacteria group bacterium GW2011_GWA2_36_10]|nr:MAG: Chromosome partition protein Smc [Parcubacteria group bacterium GW2011_GWA2_36_10]
MYLEKLEIQGFKSFAKNTTLVFNRELTTIVGPNGSGKSNIADAVRWVLGEQSAKTLRGKKSDDVIFAGSDKKGRLGFAQVDLYLNNQDNLLNLDYDQIIVSRKIDRNGESEYLLNGSKVRLLDVQLLLAQANFGQKTYSVIGQGMIDSILTSSAAERKEFFDEATGVKQFQIKKDQAISKLDHAKENLAQSEQILAELEPRLKSLQRQVNKLERRESLEQELKNLQNDYYSFLLSNLNLDLNKKNIAFEAAKNKEI